MISPATTTASPTASRAAVTVSVFWATALSVACTVATSEPTASKVACACDLPLAGSIERGRNRSGQDALGLERGGDAQVRLGDRIQGREDVRGVSLADRIKGSSCGQTLLSQSFKACRRYQRRLGHRIQGRGHGELLARYRIQRSGDRAHHSRHRIQRGRVGELPLRERLQRGGDRVGYLDRRDGVQSGGGRSPSLASCLQGGGDRPDQSRNSIQLRGDQEASTSSRFERARKRQSFPRCRLKGRCGRQRLLSGGF